MHTFSDPLHRAQRVAGARTALICGEDRLDYRELGTRCRRIAGALDASGLAAARGETGTLYVTQIFAARRP